MRDGASDARDRIAGDERVGVCVQLVAGWRRLEAKGAAGEKSGVARSFLGRPGRLSLGGVGGCCMLGLTQGPVLWSTWQAVVGDRRKVRGFSFEYVGAQGTEADRLGQRAKSL